MISSEAQAGQKDNFYKKLKLLKNEKKTWKKNPPDVGVEPTTVGLKVQRSTTELTGLDVKVLLPWILKQNDISVVQEDFDDKNQML